MAKIIQIAVLIEDKDADNIYPKLRDQLHAIPIIKDIAFNGKWINCDIDNNYQSGEFIQTLVGM